MRNNALMVLKLAKRIQEVPIENWKERNLGLKKLLSELMKAETRGENPISLSHLLISNLSQPSLKTFIVWYLRQYSQNEAKKTLMELQDSDPMAWILLTNWEEDQKRIETQNIGRMEHFHKK